MWGAGYHESCGESTGALFWCVALFQQGNGFHEKSGFVPVALLHSEVLDNQTGRMTALPTILFPVQPEQRKHKMNKAENVYMRWKVFIMECFESPIYTKSAVFQKMREQLISYPAVVFLHSIKWLHIKYVLFLCFRLHRSWGRHSAAFLWCRE